MTLSQLLSEVGKRGITLRAEGDRLRYRPTEAVTEPLRDGLRVHKEELLRLLAVEPPVRGALTGGVSPDEWPLSAEEVMGMPLATFRAAGLVVGVYSEILRESVIFASDNAVVDPGERRVIYRAAELQALRPLSVHGLQQVHRVKRIFGGTILPS